MLRRMRGGVGFAAFLVVVALLLLVTCPGRALAKHKKKGSSGSVTIESFQASGAGTGFGSTSSSSCPTDDFCYALTGNLNGNPIGGATFSAMVNAVSAPDVPNGSGGTCVPASGTMTIAFGGNKSIALNFVGNFCDVGPAPSGLSVGPVSFDGSFFVTGGSGGKYADLDGNSGPNEGGAGTGHLTLSGDTDDGDVLVVVSGVLAFTPAM